MQFLLLCFMVALLFVLLFIFIPLAIAGYAWALWCCIIVGLGCGVYCIVTLICQKKLKQRLAREKKEVFDSFKSQGFKSTHQYKVSGQLFAIDENSRQWFVMRYADPKSTMLHRFDEIRSYERRENTQTQTLGTGMAATSWLGVASFTSQKVYTKLGVLVTLNNIKHPTEFISCMGNEDGVDEVLNIFDIITDND